MDEYLSRAPIGIINIGKCGEINDINSAGAELLDTNCKELRGRQAADVIPQSAAGTLHNAISTTPSTECSIEEYYPTIDRWLTVDITVVDETTVLYLQDVTTRHADRQTVEQLQQRLSRLESIDSLIATVLQQLIDASDQEEVWETIVKRLGTADLYEFVWLGDRDLANDRLHIAASAGEAPNVLAAIDAELGSTATLPEQRAVRSGSSCIVETIPEAENIPRDLRVAAFGRGLQAVIAVPLSPGDTVSGVLGVYVSREAGISPQERASLDVLGSVAGFAVTAIRQAELLFADTVTELRLSIRDETVPFIAASEAANTSFSLEGAVVRDDDTVVCYLRTEDSLDQVMAVLGQQEAVATVRRIQDGENTAVVEASLTGSTPLTTFTNWGATVTEGSYTGKKAEFTVELPPNSDVRSMVETVDEQFKKTAVRSRVKKPREPETMETFQQRLTDSLTEQQHRVLQTAYFADYFQSPRGSTSEELAEALDISGPTVLYHLRNAQRALLNAFFQE